MIALRPACSNDYAFALVLYVEAIKPLTSTWTNLICERRKAEFASLWSPDDAWIIVLDGEDVGWVEVRATGDEVFLRQLYISPAHQRRGIGSYVMERLLEERRRTARSMALFVLKNNPAFRFYERHGFSIVREIGSRFVMRREMVEAA